jgi:hypothetical protein
VPAPGCTVHSGATAGTAAWPHGWAARNSGSCCRAITLPTAWHWPKTCVRLSGNWPLPIATAVGDRVTISIGVALQDNHDTEQHADADADRALYRAKNQGAIRWYAPRRHPIYWPEPQPTKARINRAFSDGATMRPQAQTLPHRDTSPAWFRYRNAGPVHH